MFFCVLHTIYSSVIKPRKKAGAVNFYSCKFPTLYLYLQVVLCGLKGEHRMKFDQTKYELIQKKTIDEIKSDGYLLRHRKSGARIAVLENDDDNKVFYIGFRTPPFDSTGVPHILEHSVLCGSDKYPAKEPFVELVKGSLNTFLNAMTYPDKTVYPIASCNDVDFKNIMDVYMDAVLHPNIYKRKEIFLQEGWHYEIDSPEGELTYNGVVYNEMKGAFSSPDDVLWRYCMNSLYPDVSYGTESGGDPDFIPDLTYEDFLGFHKKLYHPSNSYIYLYGNCDMEERLQYLDEKYLSEYDAIEVDSDIEEQIPFRNMKRVEVDYSIAKEEDPAGKAYLAYNVSIENSLDKELCMAFNFLEYALLASPGAPVKQALIDAGIGEDVFSRYDNGIKQPMFSIVAKNVDKNKEQEFLDIIRDTLTRLAEEGINKETLRAAINSEEFSHREADFGRMPKGLIYGLSMLDSWLYKDSEPFLYLELNEVYEDMKRKLSTNYYEELVKQYLLKNTHASLVVLNPVPDLTSANEVAVAKKLADYKASLSEEELNRIIEETKALKEYQMTRSTKEELETIPSLSREDIGKDIRPIVNSIEEVSGVLVDNHDIYTNGIGYLNLSFDLANVEDDELPYAALLNIVMGYINTTEHSYEELSNEIDIHTGGIYSEMAFYQKVNDKDVTPRTNVKCKALLGKLPKALDIILETMFKSCYDDHKRLKEVLAEVKSGLQSKIISAGHIVARTQCMAQFSLASKYSALTSGIDFYEFITDLYENYDERKELITKKLNAVTEKVFVQDRLIVSFTSAKEDYDNFKPELQKFINALPKGGLKPATRAIEPVKCKTGYTTASQVNYVARCGKFNDAGFEYDASLKVLTTILSYNYLWDNIRVLGGAYGCSNGYTINGNGFYVSYRDPNVAKTNEVFEKTVDFVRDFDVSDDEMTRFIIGTFSDMDAPLTPLAKGNRSFDFYMRDYTEDMLKAERLKVLNTYQKDIRALAPIIEAIIDGDYLCVIGNSDKITKESELFDRITSI